MNNYENMGSTSACIEKAVERSAALTSVEINDNSLPFQRTDFSFLYKSEILIKKNYKKTVMISCMKNAVYN